MKVNLKINKKLLPVLTKPQPIKVFYGGRGSGKSIGVGDAATVRLSEGHDIYCLREFQDSVADSVHRVIEDSINKRLMLDGWDIQEKKIVSPMGGKTNYKGANRNPDSMQSAQGYLYSWFEEAHRASQTSLDKLLPTIIRNKGAQCWFTANPQSSADPFSQRFIIPYQDQLQSQGFYEDNLHYIVKVNWRDNPWWNEEQEQLRRHDYETMERSKYDWIWEGEFNDGVDDAIIIPEWFDACVDACEKLGIEPSGARVTSYDPADTGDDLNAYASRRGVHFDEINEIDKPNGNLACDWACDRAKHLNTDLFVYDGDGMGALLRKQIAQNFAGVKCDTRMFKGSSGVDNPKTPYDGVYSEGQKTNKDMFANKRAQYWIELARRMELTYRAVVLKEYINPEDIVSIAGDIKLLYKLRAEVCGVPRKKNLTGKIQLMSKPEMLRVYMRSSPNMGDCLAMAMESPELTNRPVTIEFEGWA